CHTRHSHDVAEGAGVTRVLGKRGVFVGHGNHCPRLRSRREPVPWGARALGVYSPRPCTQFQNVARMRENWGSTAIAPTTVASRTATVRAISTPFDQAA